MPHPNPKLRFLLPLAALPRGVVFLFMSARFYRINRAVKMARLDNKLKWSCLLIVVNVAFFSCTQHPPMNSDTVIGLK